MCLMKSIKGQHLAFVFTSQGLKRALDAELFFTWNQLEANWKVIEYFWLAGRAATGISKQCTCIVDPYTVQSAIQNMAIVAERLRRLTRNQLGSPRAGSSPADCGVQEIFLGSIIIFLDFEKKSSPIPFSPKMRSWAAIMMNRTGSAVPVSWHLLLDICCLPSDIHYNQNGYRDSYPITDKKCKARSESWSQIVPSVLKQLRLQTLSWRTRWPLDLDMAARYGWLSLERWGGHMVCCTR